MEQFISNMYRIGRIDAEKVLSYVPKFITKEQAEAIIRSK